MSNSDPDHGSAREAESHNDGPLDAVNEATRKVLGDAEVDYGAEGGHPPVSEAAVEAEAQAHGDTVTQNPDGTHSVINPAPED